MAAVQDDTLNISIPLPRSLDTRIYIRLSTQAKAIVLSLTTSTQDDLASAKPMGSFVYALPNRFDDKQPLSTTLFSSESSVEITTRLAKLLARRTQLPVYVTNSMSFANAGMGGTVEEEMEAFKNIVSVTVDKLRAARVGALAVNGEPTV
ncbi:20S proteasome chaperone domain-containing protein [Pochonia chlamydosporia 170]|uniref:20S proteasome chaperone domain-containing protein n=1 Tax=Pochonia chlamydosporia 170 TaxID=1380566 RepID=A0A179FQC0_METCM|nr:20S proteasome chaperone domain-containing protein [Pochonia chlamydosporia 170]OAQ67784.1 20S proteasome chaperone domain-containing protein [Pochonia chlamydosporia 170]